MRFADDKRLLLGLLAGLSALPLPLNEPRPEGVVGWGYLLLFELGVVFFLLRVRRGEERWLGNWALNLLGVCYIPFLLLDVTALSSGQLLRPAMHLALFVVLAKLYSLRRDRDKWQTLVAIFFVFITAMATSASPGIVVYLIAFALLKARVLNAFSNFHLLTAQPGAAAVERPDVDRGASRLVWVALLLAVPLFIALPRFREPFILGSGSYGNSTTTGFSDEAGLDVIGRIRTSREVALRIETLRGALPSELRLRGAAFDHYAVDHWQRSTDARLLSRDPRRRGYQLAETPSTAAARIWLEPIGTRSLIVPQETTAVEFVSNSRTPALGINRGGALGFAFRPSETLTYTVELADRPVPLALPPGGEEDVLRSQNGVTREIADLAASVVDAADDQTDLQRARAIERHLISEYSYTLDFVGRMGVDPIREFLFEHRSGHCEYFASSMVLMLRALDIPARYVTGFLGAEESSMGYTIVRQGNAHAWVEAWVQDGWRTFDPTPPDGRPGVVRGSIGELLRQAYDFVIFRWDRYVITFSRGDQAQVWDRVRAWIAGLLGGSRAESSASDDDRPVVVRSTDSAVANEASEQSPRGLGLVATVVVLTVLLLFWVLRPSRLMEPVQAYRRLGRLGEKIGVPWRPATAPRRYEAELVAACPELDEPVRRLVTLYLQQSFSGRPLLGRRPSKSEQQALHHELSELLDAIRAAVARRRAEQRREAKRSRADSAEVDHQPDASERRRAS